MPIFSVKFIYSYSYIFTGSSYLAFSPRNYIYREFFSLRCIKITYCPDVTGLSGQVRPDYASVFVKDARHKAY